MESMPTYTTEELTALMKKRKITSDFIGDASRVYGKMFNQHEVEIIVRMIDYIGFDGECVLLLLSYSKLFMVTCNNQNGESFIRAAGLPYAPNNTGLF
jgi:hypothetical protein